MGNTSCKKGHIIEKGCPKQHDSTRSQTAVAEVLELVDPIAPGLGEGMSHELVRSARTIGLVFARKIYRKAMVFTDFTIYSRSWGFPVNLPVNKSK